ncbi:MAG: DUF4388 domain-containing protein [Actinomycetota bacterium]|nr:DUF4388 domain-containing protein [Actinomycetota bacterium]
MKLEGSLDAFSLQDVFQLLSLTKKSGGLHLANGQAVGVVYFDDGAITGSVSDASQQALARRLIGVGACDDAALRRAVERACVEPVGVARALVESGGADPEVVREHALEQTVDSVFDLLRWPEGDFSLAVGEPNPDDVGIAVPAEKVVAEANARREAWEAVSRVIPSPDVVLVMPVVITEEPGVGRDEWALLALVDGRRTVGELVEVSGAGTFGVVSKLAQMVQRGLLALADDEATDHVTLVHRRHLLLAPLEPEPAPSPAPASQPPSDGASAGADSAGSAHRSPVPRPDPAPRTEPAAAAATLAIPLVGGAHAPQEVVPARHEPFLPRRPLSHPESPPAEQPVSIPAADSGRPAAVPAMPPPGVRTGVPAGYPTAATGTMGAPATAPSTEPTIEPDPSLNRSLLLRLIAGVRGL